MADNNNGGGAAPTQNNPNPADGSQPNNSAPQGTQTFDTSKITDAQFDELSKDGRFWNIAFKHERFTKLNERAKKADEYEANQKKSDEQKLIEQKKFEELAAQREKEANDFKSRFEKSQIDNKIITAANKLGVVDPDAVLTLIDRKNIKLADDGTTSGIDEALKALVDTKPYLKGNQSVPNVGAGSNPAGQGQNQPPKFKHSQIKDPKFYREHEKEILEAMRMGLIEEDLKGQS
jgi:hypothetical protein